MSRFRCNLVSEAIPVEFRDARHLRWVREQGCCVPGCCRGGVIHAHHVRTAANSGTALKPSDQWTIGLCARHHDLLHRHGVKWFEATYHVDLQLLARQYAASSGTVLLWGNF